MEPQIINLHEIQSNHFDLEKTTSKINLSALLMDNEGNYVNEIGMFMVHFNSIPNVIKEIGIDCKKAYKWFMENYKAEIKDMYFNKFRRGDNKPSAFDNVYFFIYNDLIVNFNFRNHKVSYYFKKTDSHIIDDVINKIEKFKERKKKHKPEISLLIESVRGFEMKFLPVSKPKLSIEDNYNDDFRDVHEIIIRRLSKKNDKGLVLLHGKPGTGKTNYLRYLIASIKKNVIFLPPNMASAITNPDLISILIENPNSIFVIEDAENIIVDREKEGQSHVSALLNISDGLLSDCLNIQIICSFNTDISKVDTALMRKGRLIAKYEFKELDVEKANSLSKKLGFSSNFIVPMTLTSIYNQGEKDFEQTKKQNPIGFKTVSVN